jgi:gametolysin peptidase M11
VSRWFRSGACCSVRHVLRVFRVALVGALLALGIAAPVKAVTGDQRVLVMLATWGPTPFQAADVRRVVFTEADALVRRASFGRASLRGEVTSWLSVLPPSPECTDEWWASGIPRSVSVPSQAAAVERGYRLADYNRFVYLMPTSRCAFIGLGAGEEALLNGVISPELVVHELGHTWGLGHAGAAACIDTCPLEEDGDYYSLMGIGSSDFTVPEKVRLGWLRPVAQTPRPGTYRITRADLLSTRPALRIPTALGSYWIEYRPQRLDLGRRGILPGGVILRWVSDEEIDDTLATTSVLMTNASGRGRPMAVPGESLRLAGVIRVDFLRRRGNDAVLRFRWNDRLAPRPPDVTQPSGFTPTGSTVRVRWELPFERGSGVATYRVSLDGGPVQSVRDREFVLTGLSTGAHFVSVFAVDRAGNRGLATIQRFEVR